MSGLKQKLINWAFGEAIRDEAARLVKQSASSASIDPDDYRWRGLLQSRRDLQPVEQDRLIEIANYLATQNPLGNKIRKTRRDFVIGDGLTIDCEDKKFIQPLVDEFWADPVNNMDEFQIQIVDFFGINGELFLPVFVNEFSGAVQLGWIDPFEVELVFADKMNRRVMRVVQMKPGAGAGFSTYYDLSVRKSYEVVNVDLNPRSPSYNYRTGELLFFKTNCAPDATRGRSDFEPIADLLDAHDQATFNDLERVALLLNFIWDVKLTGKSDTEIQDWLRTQNAPLPGSIRAHNENVEWAAVAPDLKFTETRMLANGIRQDALGVADLSNYFMGITEGANKSSSENIEVPILKALQARQRAVRAVFREIVDFGIDRRLLRKPALKRKVEAGEVSRKFEIRMPELSTRDISRVGSVIAQMTAAIDTAIARNWITNETAARTFASFVSQLGVEYDVDEELKAADQQKEEAAKSDYTDGKLSDLKTRMSEATGQVN